MSYFIKKLYNEQRGFVDFHFNGFNTICCGTKFHITVAGCKGEHCHFTMQEAKGGWEIINAPKPPEWILHFENELSRAINEHMEEVVQTLV